MPTPSSRMRLHAYAIDFYTPSIEWAALHHQERRPSYFPPRTVHKPHPFKNFRFPPGSLRAVDPPLRRPCLVLARARQGQTRR